MQAVAYTYACAYHTYISVYPYGEPGAVSQRSTFAGAQVALRRLGITFRADSSFRHAPKRERCICVMCACTFLCSASARPAFTLVRARVSDDRRPRKKSTMTTTIILTPFSRICVHALLLALLLSMQRTPRCKYSVGRIMKGFAGISVKGLAWCPN